MTKIERKVLASGLLLAGIWMFFLTTLFTLEKINATPLIISFVILLPVIPWAIYQTYKKM